MKSEYTISLFLDNRRLKQNGKYPVKLRVYSTRLKKRKYYPTKFDFTEQEFKDITEAIKPRGEAKQLQKQLRTIELRAEEIADSLSVFSFEQFEKHLFRKEGDGLKLTYHYDLTIKELLSRNQIGTANTYELSKKSFDAYLKDMKGKGIDTLSLSSITPKWLNDYETYMTSNERSLTTVSIYVRTLRAIFNKAIEQGEIPKELYPFGKGGYQVPSTENKKKALNKVELKLLFDAEAMTEEQERARDFWFFSYSCNGMNIKDIAWLRYKDIKGDKIEFVRAKTKRTSKKNLKTITVYLSDFALQVIEKYGNEKKAPSSLVFDVVKDSYSSVEGQKAVKNFTRFINQHVRKLCEVNDLPTDITTYTARHSFASNFIQSGATVVDVMESLGHSDLKTTQNYLKSFDDEERKNKSNSLMNF